MKLYRKLRKKIVLRFFWRKLTYCRDCMWEARASAGIYSNNEAIPDDKVEFVEKRYKTEYYYAHLDPWGYRSKVVER